MSWHQPFKSPRTPASLNADDDGPAIRAALRHRRQSRGFESVYHCCDVLRSGWMSRVGEGHSGFDWTLPDSGIDAAWSGDAYVLFRNSQQKHPSFFSTRSLRQNALPTLKCSRRGRSLPAAYVTARLRLGRPKRRQQLRFTVIQRRSPRRVTAPRKIFVFRQFNSAFEEYVRVRIVPAVAVEPSQSDA